MPIDDGCADKCQHGDNEVTAQLTTIMQMPIIADGRAYSEAWLSSAIYVDDQGD